MAEASITAIVDEVTLETKVVTKVEFRHILMRAYADGYSACADHAFDRTEKELSDCHVRGSR